MIEIRAVALLGGLLFAGACSGPSAPAALADAAPAPVPVQTIPAAVRTFTEELVISSDVAAVRVAKVGARIPGVLATIAIDEGDRVVADVTELFRTDQVKLEQALVIAEGQVAVATAAVAARQAELARLRVDLEKAIVDHERFVRLFEQDQAVTRDAVENQASRRRQLAAAVTAGEAAVRLAEAQAAQAAGAVVLADKDLADAVVRAPLSGVVTARRLEPGEYAGVGATVVCIEDPSLVEVTGHLPEAYYARVHPGETVVAIQVGDLDLGEHRVTAISPVVSSPLRTFAVRCRIADPPAAAVPGRPARMGLRLATRDALGVPAEAVRVGRDGEMVFVVVAGRALRRTVVTGQRGAGWIEITGGDLKVGEPVLVAGPDRLAEGAAVRVMTGDAP
jgi:RND family efflux transporter MFP subunit